MNPSKIKNLFKKRDESLDAITVAAEETAELVAAGRATIRKADRLLDITLAAVILLSAVEVGIMLYRLHRDTNGND